MRKDKRCEVKGPRDPVTGKRLSYYGASPEEARAARDAALGIDPTPSEDSLYDYYVRVYLPTIMHRSQNWRSQVAWAMDKYILPWFAGEDIRTITRASLQNHFNRNLGNLSPSSRNKVKIVLSGILNLAEQDEIIPRNPASTIRLPAPTEPVKQALSPLELRQLIDSSRGQVRSFILLSGLCGLRIGEACAVTTADIHEGILHVENQVLQPPGGPHVTSTLKTPQSKRRIALPAALEAELVSGREAFVIQQSRTRTTRLFCTPSNVARELKRHQAEKGLKDVSPHELRHTFISILENDLGCPQNLVLELAGKARVNSYSHGREELHREWMSKLWETVMNATVRLEVLEA